MREIDAALEAARYADTVLRRTATDLPDPESAAGLNHPAYDEPSPDNTIRIPPDQPHDQWRPRHGNNLDYLQWHPPYGETHVKYHVYPIGGGNGKRKLYRANHHGINLGMQTVHDPNGTRPSIEMPKYSTGDEPERILNEGGSHPLNFRSLNEAQAAAEKHYDENYGQPQKHNYDIEKITDEHDARPPRRGLGDDEDYGHIFSMIRRALRYANRVMHRTASDDFDGLAEQFQNIMKPAYDPRADQPGTAGLWHWYKNQHPERTSPQSLYDFATWHDRHIQPGTKQHAYDIAKGEVANDNDGQMPGWTSRWGHTFGPDDDDLSSWHDSVGAPGDRQSTTGLAYTDPQGNPQLLRDPISQPHGYNSEGFDPDEKQDPFDPRLIGAGIHRRYVEAAWKQAVIPGELFPPCPDCGQVAGFQEHPVSPSVVTCRNCDYPMLDENMNRMVGEMLGDHDRAVAALPEIDHPTLGKHGSVDHEGLCAQCGEPVAEDPDYGGYVHLDEDGEPIREDSDHYASPEYSSDKPRRFNDTLDHDIDISMLPETDHPTLGKHGMARVATWEDPDRPGNHITLSDTPERGYPRVMLPVRKKDSLNDLYNAQMRAQMSPMVDHLNRPENQVEDLDFGHTDRHWPPEYGREVTGMARRVGPGHYEHDTPYGTFAIRAIHNRDRDPDDPWRGGASWYLHPPSWDGSPDDQPSDVFASKAQALAAAKRMQSDPETYGLNIRQAQLSYEDAMKLIDEQLAAGEPADPEEHYDEDGPRCPGCDSESVGTPAVGYHPEGTYDCYDCGNHFRPPTHERN